MYVVEWFAPLPFAAGIGSPNSVLARRLVGLVISPGGEGAVKLATCETWIGDEGSSPAKRRIIMAV